MTFKTYKSAIAASVSVLAISMASGAMAQDAGVNQLGEVIVTAQKRAENLQQTPIAITAISAENLAATGTQSMLDLNTKVPNLFVGGAGAAGKNAGTFFIRGIGVDTDTLAKEPGVGLYIDDFYYGHTAGSLLSVLDVESVEVLRGPQGTLFGKNTIGGAIRYTSVKPEFVPGFKIEGNLGEMERADLKASVNYPFTEQLAVRLSAGTLNQDGYVKSIPLNKNLGDDHTDSARAQLRFKNDKWDINLSGDVTQSESNGSPTHLDIINPSPTSSAALYNKIVAGTAPVPFYNTAQYAGLVGSGKLYDGRYFAGPYETYATNVGYDLEGYGINLTGAYEVNDNLTIKSLTGYRRNKVVYRNDNDQSPLNWNQNQVSQVLPSFSQEIQFLGDLFDKRLHYIAGLYYYNETPSVINNRDFPGEPDGNQQFDDVETTSKAAFAQLDWQVISKVKLTLGGRYSEDEKDATTTRSKVLQTAAGLPATPEAASATGFVATTATKFGPVTGHGNTTFHNFSPKAALQVQWTDDVMTYGSLSKGYRAGGFNNGIALYNPTTGANPNNGILPFNNETTWTYEVGARTELFDRRVRLNASVFKTDYTDLQVSSSQITGVGSASFIKIDNVAKAEIQGYELEFVWKVIGDLTVGADVGHIDAKYLEIAPTVTAITKTSKLAGAPSDTYALWLAYNPKLPNGGDLDISVNYGHQSEVSTVTSAATAVILPSYGLLGASAFYNFPDGKTSVGVTGKNLTDERYLIGGTSLVSVAAGNAGMQYTHIGRPREVYATVRYKY